MALAPTGANVLGEVGMKIALDIDGVLADLGIPLCTALREKYAISLEPEDLVVYDWEAFLGMAQKEELDFFEYALFGQGHAPQMPSSAWGVKELEKRGHDLVIATNRIESTRTRSWLEAQGWGHIPALFLNNREATRDSMINVDVMLDDSPKKMARNIKHILFQAVLMDRPTNGRCLDVLGRFHRVLSWEDFIEYIDSIEGVVV